MIGGLRSSSTSKPDEGFNISEFLKSLGHTENTEPPAPSIPGLEGGPVPPVSMPVHQDSKPQQYNIESFNSSLYSVFSAPPPPPPTNMVSTVPLQPPPAPPEIFLQESSHSQWVGYEDVAPDHASSDWNNKLPPKFPTWNPELDESWESENMDESGKWEMGTPNKMAKLDDTPMSPPMFEKEGFNEPVQYDDTSGTIAEDVDHRSIVLPHGRGGKKDVDHRNLISLTGSPASHQKPRQTSWNKFESSGKDQDFRMLVPPPGRRPEVPDQDMRQPPAASIPMTPASPSPSDKATGNYSDNVESVDMEMSDEENGQDSQDSKKFDQIKKNNIGNQQQPQNDKLLNRVSHQDKINTASPNQRLNHSNGSQKTPISKSPGEISAPRPLMSPIRPLIPSLVSGPPIRPPTAQSPTTPKLLSPATSKAPLLPTPPVPLLQSPIPNPLLQSSSPLPAVRKEPPNFLSDQPEQKIQGIQSKNGDDKWSSDDWNDPDDHKFVERMLGSDPLEEDRNLAAANCRGRGQNTPQNRGRRGNHMGGPNNFRGGKTPQSEFGGNSHGPGASPGFPNRGFRGAYRPFRGGRRGQFNRW